MNHVPTIRDLHPEEFDPLGRLMVEAYASLAGFPTPQEQPQYYAMLAGIGQFTRRRDARVLVAVSQEAGLLGGVVYFGDMREYGSGGTATQATNSSGMRLLGVGPSFRGAGVGEALTRACIQLAREKRHAAVLLHTTQAMKTAWALYERLGFQRSPDLDFSQQGLPVFGFRLPLAGA